MRCPRSNAEVEVFCNEGDGVASGMTLAQVGERLLPSLRSRSITLLWLDTRHETSAADTGGLTVMKKWLVGLGGQYLSWRALGGSQMHVIPASAVPMLGNSQGKKCVASRFAGDGELFDACEWASCSDEGFPGFEAVRLLGCIPLCEVQVEWLTGPGHRDPIVLCSGQSLGPAPVLLQGLLDKEAAGVVAYFVKGSSALDLGLLMPITSSSATLSLIRPCADPRVEPLPQQMLDVLEQPPSSFCELPLGGRTGAGVRKATACHEALSEALARTTRIMAEDGDQASTASQHSSCAVSSPTSRLTSNGSLAGESSSLGGESPQDHGTATLPLPYLLDAVFAEFAAGVLGERVTYTNECVKRNTRAKKAQNTCLREKLDAACAKRLHEGKLSKKRKLATGCSGAHPSSCYPAPPCMARKETAECSASETSESAGVARVLAAAQEAYKCAVEGSGDWCKYVVEIVPSYVEQGVLLGDLSSKLQLSLKQLNSKYKAKKGQPASQRKSKINEYRLQAMLLLQFAVMGKKKEAMPRGKQEKLAEKLRRLLQAISFYLNTPGTGTGPKGKSGPTPFASLLGTMTETYGEHLPHALITLCNSLELDIPEGLEALRSSPRTLSATKLKAESKAEPKGCAGALGPASASALGSLGLLGLGSSLPRSGSLSRSSSVRSQSSAKAMPRFRATNPGVEVPVKSSAGNLTLRRSVTASSALAKGCDGAGSSANMRKRSAMAGSSALSALTRRRTAPAASKSSAPPAKRRVLVEETPQKPELPQGARLDMTGLKFVMDSPDKR
ncbi:unnamed protein product [Chrysoparadoxa australica]